MRALGICDCLSRNLLHNMAKIMLTCCKTSLFVVVFFLLFFFFFFAAMVIIYEPPRDKTNKMACAPSEDSDQPGHPPSLIRVFAVDAQADLSLRCPHEESLGP